MASVTAGKRTRAPFISSQGGSISMCQLISTAKRKDQICGGRCVKGKKSYVFSKQGKKRKENLMCSC